MKKFISTTKKTLDKMNPDTVYKVLAIAFCGQCIFAESWFAKIFGLVAFIMVFYFDNHD